MRPSPSRVSRRYAQKRALFPVEVRDDNEKVVDQDEEGMDTRSALPPWTPSAAEDLEGDSQQSEPDYPLD
jgi:hypothetical protein